jgi:hypothetical protein
MNKDISLHPKYGVNPSMGVCFWCGKDDGTVLLLGHNKGKEAPRRMVASYEPCPDCRDLMSKGITVMEAREPRDGSSEPRPTGRWVVVSAEAIQRVITPPEFAEQIIAGKKTFCDVQAFTNLFGHLFDQPDAPISDSQKG